MKTDRIVITEKTTGKLQKATTTPFLYFKASERAREKRGETGEEDEGTSVNQILKSS